jgi:hypothetical protein
MPKPTVRAARVGPWHARKALAYLDARTQEGAFAASLRAELLADQGPDPSASRRLLVDLVTFSALMVSRLAQPIAKGAEPPPEQREELRAWQRELRDSLRALGLDRATQERAPSLAEYLRDAAGRKGPGA